MSRLMVAAQVVKDSVSALDVGRVIGLDVDRHGRCPCPFHAGRDRNLKLFPGNRGYNCFVCHSAGDVIKFIQGYYKIGFKDSLLWFDGTFHLGLDLGKPIDREQQRTAEKALQMRKRRAEFEEWKERMRFDLALTADDIVRKLEETRDAYRPRRYGEEWDERFCRAVLLLPEARKFADDCMMECMKERKA